MNHCTRTKKRHIRELGGLAWERELRAAIENIGQSIGQMCDGKLTPFEVNDLIHVFHNGISRELFNRYSQTTPWFAVCRAYSEGVLKDEDLAGISDSMRNRLREHRSQFQTSD